MKKLSLSLLMMATMTLALNINAFAVDATTGVVEDPKKADEALVNKATAKKQTMEEKRAASKAKHKAKMEDRAAAKAKAKQAAEQAAAAASKDVSQATPDPMKEMNRDAKIQEIKEETAPKK